VPEFDWGAPLIADEAAEFGGGCTKAELRAVTQAAERLAGMLPMPKIALPKLRADLEKLDARKEALDRDIAELEAQRDERARIAETVELVARWAAEDKRRLDTMTYDERRDVLFMLGVRVEVFPFEHKPQWVIGMRIDPRNLPLKELLGPQGMANLEPPDWWPGSTVPRKGVRVLKPA
jgi:hypothetical protein